jgi:threonine dehydrogenase-like Zn-dependent dehydrogenase
MKALQIETPTEFRVREVPVPEPGAGEVRVRVDAVTICTQWDLHLRHNDPMYPGHQFQYPYTLAQPGHEASGVIDAIGEGITALQPGDRVSVWRDPGHDRQGCYAQFVVRPEHDVIRVPEKLTAVATAPVELAMCVACSVLRMKSMGVLNGARLAVAGLGPAGLIAVQMLRAEGAATITGIDPVEARREAAITLGADRALSPQEAEAALPLRQNAELDSAIDCVGSARSVHFLMDRVADTVQLFGVQREDYTFAFRHYIGLRLSGYPPHYRGAAEYVVSLLESDRLDLLPLVSHQLPFSRYDEAMNLLEQQKATKVCLMPWEE